MLLAEETLKIVIAVISIGFLVYFLVNLYFTNSGAQKVSEAIGSVEKLMGEVEKVNLDNVEREDHVQNPNGWRVMSFVGEEVKPNSCVGENCLCICKNVLINRGLFEKNRQAKACDEKGSCGIVENLKKFDKIKIGRDGTFVAIKKLNGLIEIFKK